MLLRVTALVCSVFVSSISVSIHAEPKHAFAMHGDTKYPADFKHFDYVNPNAPKGGTLRLSAIGNGYDSFNPHIIKGVAASGLTSYLYDTLTHQSADEAFTEYGLIAEKVDMPEDRSWVAFHLNPSATFHDGKPITVEDVIYTFEALTSKGHPFYRSYYGDVATVSKTDTHVVRFDFKETENRELPLILGQLPVLPKHYWESREFDKTTLEPPIGSGPYRIKSFEAGRSITYERVKDYWAADLPVNVGHHNFDEIVIEYYADPTVALEAFKAGQYDFRAENTAKNWATAYTGNAIDAGKIIKEEIAHQRPTGMQAFLMNTRRDLFQSPDVRRAMALGFDFEWTNKQLFYGQYTRTDSFFENSELASSGLPEGEELAILERFKDKLPEAVFNTPYTLPVTKGDGNIRTQLREAKALLKSAGWEIKGNQLVNSKTGKPFEFEILLISKDFERIVLPYARNLKRLGINASVRLVDTSQYVQRMRSFDYDMVVGNLGQSNSPGNEQRDYWSSATADINGSRNYMGIRDPVIDELLELVIQAPDRAALVARTRALDRVLLHGNYVVPQWHVAIERLAYWAYLKRPDVTPSSGVSLDTWWMEPKAP